MSGAFLIAMIFSKNLEGHYEWHHYLHFKATRFGAMILTLQGIQVISVLLRNKPTTCLMSSCNTVDLHRTAGIVHGVSSVLAMHDTDRGRMTLTIPPNLALGMRCLCPSICVLFWLDVGVNWPQECLSLDSRCGTAGASIVGAYPPTIRTKSQV